MANFDNDLIASLEQAVAHARGARAAGRTHIMHLPDVRKLRTRLKMSQQGFSKAYGIPLATLKGWEQGRRQPDATAMAYLKLIEKMPVEAKSVLQE